MVAMPMIAMTVAAVAVVVAVTIVVPVAMSTMIVVMIVAAVTVVMTMVAMRHGMIAMSVVAMRIFGAIPVSIAAVAIIVMTMPMAMIVMAIPMAVIVVSPMAVAMTVVMAVRVIAMPHVMHDLFRNHGREQRCDQRSVVFGLRILVPGDVAIGIRRCTRQQRRIQDHGDGPDQ